MIRIAIVDDETEQIMQIKQIVTAFFDEKKIKISVNTFTSGEVLLSDSTFYDLIFLDIQMNGLDGIETAQRLRVKSKMTALFYITSYEKYIQKSMTIHPFAFIVKPFSREEIHKNLEDYLVYTNSVSEKKFKDIYQIHTINGHHFQIDMDDILYFHYLENRIVEVIVKNEKYKIKDGIMHIYPTLNKEHFIIPNQSFIVNLHHVREIDGKNKKIVMDNGDLILIPRRKFNEVIDVLSRYIADEKG